LSSDPDNEYFSDGLTEEITADLSRVRALRVISRTSAMQLKGAKKDVRAIGRELGVRYVLEGGVRKAGGSLRITAQLIDADDDTHLWSEKYKGTLDDVFALQERVSREIVRALDVTLTSEDDRRLAERPIADPRVYELFIRARQELRRLGGEAIGRATKLLAQAVEIEGETPPLKALRAWTRISLARTGLRLDERPLDEAERLSRELVEEVPGAPYGHALLGSVRYERGDLPGAVRNFVAALEIEPNDAEALFFLGISYIAAGQNDRVWETSRRLLASDPLSPLAWSLAGATRWFVGRFEEALPDLLHAEEIDPRNFMLVWTSGYTFAALGRLGEAATRVAILRQVGPGATYTRQLLSLLEALEGKPEAALQGLSTLDLAPLDAHNKFHLAESFAMAGDTARALELLEAAVEQGFHPFPFISEHCPFFAPLRSLPPFARIRERARSLTDAFRESEQGIGLRG
jgi:non-specific serine/threonine protein kinase